MAYRKIVFLSFVLLFCQAHDLSAKVLTVINTNTTVSGGIGVLVKGINLNSTIHEMTVNTTTGKKKTTCIPRSDSEMICPTPNTTDSFHTIQKMSCEMTKQLAKPLDYLSILLPKNDDKTLSWLTVYADPEFCKKRSTVQYVSDPSQKIQHIQGTDLTFLRTSDIVVRVGDTKSEVTKIAYGVEYRPPEQNTKTNNRRAPVPIKVQIGNRVYDAGTLQYETFWERFMFITAISITCVLMFWIVLVWFICTYCMRKKSKKPRFASLIERESKEAAFNNTYLASRSISRISEDYSEPINITTGIPAPSPQVVAEEKKKKSSYYNDFLQLLEPEIRDKLADCKVDFKFVTLIECIGEGEFGKVFRGKLKQRGWRKRSREIAIKTLRDSSKLTFKELSSFISEALIMKGFNHPNVVALLGVSFQDCRPFVLLEYMDKGDLRSYLMKSDMNFTLGQLLDYAVQVSNGMAYLSKKKFVHRDLAARNCMINSHEDIKIADFGLSRDTTDGGYYVLKDLGRPVPVKWLALESYKGVFSTASDVWSFGVLMWEILTRGQKPYDNIENYNMKVYLEHGNRLERPEHCPLPVYEIMCTCWHVDKDQRPTFEDIKRSLKFILSANKKHDSDYQAIV